MPLHSRKLSLKALALVKKSVALAYFNKMTNPGFPEPFWQSKALVPMIWKYTEIIILIEYKLEKCKINSRRCYLNMVSYNKSLRSF